jgi:hypothetical protein
VTGKIHDALRVARRTWGSLGPSIGSSRENCLRKTLIGNIQRSISLNPSSLHRYVRDAEAWIIRDPKRIELSSIELRGDSLKCASQGLVSCTLFCRSEASSGTGPLNPNEMPTRAPDHRIESRRFDLFNLSPVLTERYSRRIYVIWQDASVTKEDRMPRHAWALFDCPIATTW